MPLGKSIQQNVVLHGIPVSPEILPQIYNSPNCISGSVRIPGEFCDPSTLSALSKFNKFLVVQRHDFFNGVIQADYIHLLQRELDMTREISPQLYPAKLSWLLNREYQKWYVDYAKSMDIGVPHHDSYVRQFGNFVSSPLEPLYCYCDQPYSVILIIMILSIGILWLWRNKRRKSRGSRLAPRCRLITSWG